MEIICYGTILSGCEDVSVKEKNEKLREHCSEINWKWWAKPGVRAIDSTFY